MTNLASLRAPGPDPQLPQLGEAASVAPSPVSAVTIAAKEPTTVALTVSLPPALVRRGRLLAAARSTSLSKVISALLADATSDLPALLADLTRDHRGAP